MPTTAIGRLHPHPAQMRTTYDLDALAALTLQLLARGLDRWQPIVAAPNGDGLHIISGHRRQMAQLFAWALQAADNEADAAEWTVDSVREQLDHAVTTAGTLEAAVAKLLTRFGERSIDYVPFTGDAKAEILALQAANYGGETPDTLGIAYSFRAALEAGASEAEIARNVGQPHHFVRNHLALTELDPELAARIGSGDLPVGVAPTIAALPDDKRAGLTLFLLANPPGRLSAKQVKQLAATLKPWPGLQLPMLLTDSQQRNKARIVVRLWQQAVESYPVDAYAAAATLILREAHAEPWRNERYLTYWLQALGGDVYYGNGGVNWLAVLEHLLPEVNCASCPIAQLPDQLLQHDLTHGQGGPRGLPCRAGQVATRCLNGLAPDDPFDCRVPWNWSDLPGIVHEHGVYRAKSYADLLTAWQAQLAREQPVVPDGHASGSVTASSNGSIEDANRPVFGSTAATAADSPITKQRAEIRAFMQASAANPLEHPFATPCGRCRHKLTSSPTQDESVPHCAWAGRVRRVSFRQLVSATDGAPRIPVCRQFAPDQPWSDLIPDHPQPASLPVAWLKNQILHLVEATNRQHHDRCAFEFLTGRPLSASEPYEHWFAEQLEAQIGDVRPAQLFTLFIWAHAEWQRASATDIDLPTNAHALQFVPYREQRWQPAA